MTDLHGFDQGQCNFQLTKQNSSFCPVHSEGSVFNPHYPACNKASLETLKYTINIRFVHLIEGKPSI